ncbi:MAG TPA: biotin/lipoyl-containing protein [Fimbriimonadaceae bacterium]|nr:biotin/lipoyl-containing protein [Fimbriimonadaceae bacterium]
MKRFVNGAEVELQSDPVEIVSMGDRLVVKTPEGAFSAAAVRTGDKVLVSYRGRTYTVEKATARSSRGGGNASGEMRAPMPGQIVDVLLAVGAEVRKGDKILVLEAMKTQQAFVAPFDGTLKELPVSRGEQVSDGQLLALVVSSEGAE